MLKTYHNFFRILFQVSDAVLVTLAWVTAYWIRFYSGFDFLPKVNDVPEMTIYLNSLFVILFIWYVCLELFGSYRSWRTSTFLKESFNILKASGLAFLLMTALHHFTSRDEYSRLMMLVFLAVVSTYLIFGRLALRSFQHALRARGWNLRHILMVGDGNIAELVARKIESRKELGLRVRGLVPVGDGSDELLALGQLDDLESVINKEGIDQVIICLKNETMPLLDSILKKIVHTNAQVRVIPDVSQYSILGFEIEQFDGLPILGINESPLVGWNSVLKRALDIVFSVFALIIFSPIMIFLALAVKLTSRGPVFYSQERMGLDGYTFNMYKFRSMRLDAEKETGAVWAKSEDDRVTWIGKFMRRTSLDELPQFFNVLVGDMSCVGPRPERPVFVEQFKDQIPGYMLRHRVKAGITGWAQINGFRGNTSLEGRIEYDLYYISNWSPFFDIKIMFLTVFKGFISPNAY